jgi:glycosyltransferase involved in cell wall biosynthesis
MKIAIIDIIGAPYNGLTPQERGLGGSESAVAWIAKELQSLNLDITVFCSCNIDHAFPGIFDGVVYLPLEELAKDWDFDIVISSRTVIPFTDPKDIPLLNDTRAYKFMDYDLYSRIVSKARQRILWMHDTFCLGDNMIEDLAVSNRITDIFALSDFHLTYVANCAHGRKRNFEVLKQKLYITRNGAVKYKSEVDINAKDKNLFVYNASLSKGMTPLVKDIWPRVKQHIPTARLKVLGGFYKFQSTALPDQQEVDWRLMAEDPSNQSLDIEFTGIIPQHQVADVMTEANYMIYPSTFPETYGISTLEAMLYNVPVITCRFGALEEVAIDEACYKIDYAIEPNGLFPEINKQQQVDKFVRMVVDAYNNKYLHQQKQHYCNIIKPIVGWDTVALQWKQHFFRRLGKYLSADEYRRVTEITHRVHKIYKRRYHNLVDLQPYKQSVEQPIAVVTTFYNCQDYIARCIESIAAQDYENYAVYLVDDASTDQTVKTVLAALDALPEHIRPRFNLTVNQVNVGAVKNQIDIIRQLDDDAIVMILDGDDSLINDNTVFNYYNTVYDGTTEFTYGSCWSMVDNIPLISQPYPEQVKQAKTYRQHHFNWILPYTHLRTFSKRLINDLDDSLFKNEGQWFRAGGDGAVFYALIEAADPSKVKCLQDIVYNYNDVNPLNDYKVNSLEQTATATKIIAMNTPKKKILIAIPTARNIEAETFKSIYDLEVPDGYETTFQYFYGYSVDQVRNLIADWTVNGFDYLFAVDSDISFPKDTLKKLLAHDRDLVSGLYIQRKPGQHVLEVYKFNDIGGVTNIPIEEIQGRGLVEIASCGFGCVLIKAEVFRAVGYPQFVYHSAINHANTISEDVDFCRKALSKGFSLWADTSVLCNHTGSWTFQVGR